MVDLIFAGLSELIIDRRVERQAMFGANLIVKHYVYDAGGF